MSPPRFRILEVETGERSVRLALPFRFGDATVTATAEAFVRVRLEGRAGTSEGVAAQLMVPRWFDKRPALSNAETIDALRDTVDIAARTAIGRDGSVRRLSLDLRQAVIDALPKDLPRLAAGFGPALLEMAVIDAACRDQGLAFPAAARADLFGLADDAPDDLGAAEIRAGLRALSPEHAIRIRHTVGHDAPLTEAEVRRRPVDGRPTALTEVIAATGINAFKIKLGGDVGHDLDRLVAIARVIDPLGPYLATVDANEQYQPEPFAELVAKIGERPELAMLRHAVAFYEQPFPREVALAPAARFDVGVPIVIDESDDADDALPRALERGWSGVSVKSCKGVLRALLNAARVRAVRAAGGRAILTAEDLTCQPGLCWQQDTVMAATVGATHVERNGHHFAGGLQGAPAAEQHAYIETHPALYDNTGGVVRLRIQDGAVALGSLFGVGFASAPGPDFGALAPLSSRKAFSP